MIIHCRTRTIFHRHIVDDDTIVRSQEGIVFGRLIVNFEFVLKTGTTATIDCNPQIGVVVAYFLHSVDAAVGQFEIRWFIRRNWLRCNVRSLKWFPKICVNLSGVVSVARVNEIDFWFRLSFNLPWYSHGNASHLFWMWVSLCWCLIQFSIQQQHPFLCLRFDVEMNSQRKWKLRSFVAIRWITNFVRSKNERNDSWLISKRQNNFDFNFSAWTPQSNDSVY